MMGALFMDEDWALDVRGLGLDCCILLLGGRLLTLCSVR